MTETTTQISSFSSIFKLDFTRGAVNEIITKLKHPYRFYYHNIYVQHIVCCLLIYSHTLCIGFHYETYIGISPYRTLVSRSSCRLSTMYGWICVSWSCEKIQTVFIFRAICENTAHVKWIRCSPKGSHLIHWTSAFPISHSNEHRLHSINSFTAKRDYHTILICFISRN